MESWQSGRSRILGKDVYGKPYRGFESLTLRQNFLANFMTTYNKLVRDKIPEILDKKDITYEKRIANEAEYRVELLKKLQEEVSEFADDASVEELADVLEVVKALEQLPEYINLESVREQKAADRGAFNERIILKGKK